MEQEVFVPVPAKRLQAALADPAQVARAVPGLQQDVGTEPVAGRLKVRIGGHTITYRGTVRVVPRADGAYAVEGDATEARGSGAVKLALTLRLRDADAGTTLRFEGTASADGRVTELPPEAVDSAVTRLLNRFAGNLGAGAAVPEDEPADDVEDADVEDVHVEDADVDDVQDAQAVHDIDEPPPPTPVFEDLTAPREPPAEAAHARRTMIGRSAEEVDHAPPRGRYAPVPAPQTVVPNSTLRWAAPAAALVVASVIVVGRALRRRG